MTNFLGFSTAIWISVLFCAWLPAPGSGLKCYICNSLADDDCDYVKDNQYLMDCSEMDKERNYTNCRKMTFSAFSEAFKMHTERTIRTCGYEKHPRLSCFHSSNKDLKGTTCECTDDGCNGSTVLHFASKVLLIVVLCGFLASLLAT